MQDNRILVLNQAGEVWVYGHLQSLGNWKKDSSVNVGDQIGAVGLALRFTPTFVRKY